MPIDPVIEAKLAALQAKVTGVETVGMDLLARAQAMHEAVVEIEDLLDLGVPPPPPPPPPPPVEPTFKNVTATVGADNRLNVRYDLVGDQAKLVLVARVGLGVGHPNGFIGFTQKATDHTGTERTITLPASIPTSVRSGGFELLQSATLNGSMPKTGNYTGDWARGDNPPPPPPPPPPPGGEIGTAGYYRVRGADVLAPDGTVFVAAGTNATGGVSYQWGGEWNPHGKVAQWKAGGLNLVRHVLYTVVSPGNHPTIQVYGQLDDLVRECEQNQVLLVVDYHNGGLGEWWPDWCVTDAITVFTGLARRFPNNKYLAFELKNEPLEEGYGDIPAARDWADKHLTIGRAVRQAGFKGLILACPSHFGQDRGTQNFWNDAQSSIMSYGDELQREIGPVVFAPHFYSRYGGQATDDSVRQQLARYRSTNKPIICTELGAYAGGFEIVQGDRQGAERLFRLQMAGQAPGIGQVPWILSAGNGPLSRGDDAFGLLYAWIAAGKP